MNALLLFISLSTGFPNGYRILTVIAIAILGYLLYALFKPEKF
jgi:K+-transporting ATPase KdpF subunit